MWLAGEFFVGTVVFIQLVMSHEVSDYGHQDMAEL